MNDKEQNRITIYKVIIGVLLVIIFLLLESYFGALNHVKEVNQKLQDTQEEYEAKSFYAGKEEGYIEGYKDAISEYGIEIDE